MRFPGRKLVQQSYRRARSRRVGGIVVLGYHRLSNERRDPLGLVVTPRHFADQLAVLVQKVQVLRLADATAALAHDAMPRRAAVVTFDDAYRDTLEEALPVLERTGVPATVFVTTGYFGQEFWWDELTRIVMDAPRLPEVLALEIGGRRRSWRLGSEGPLAAPVSTEERQLMIRAVANEIRVLRRSEQERVIRAVREWACFQDGRASAMCRAVTVEELRRMAASAYIEIGAHSVTHPVLTMLTREEQREEIHSSRAELRRVTGKPVISFSYPHGAYSTDTIAAVSEAGFAAACCSEPDVIGRGCHLLTLPRLWVQDQDAGSFARWLKSWGLTD